MILNVVILSNVVEKTVIWTKNMECMRILITFAPASKDIEIKTYLSQHKISKVILLDILAKTTTER